MVKVRLGLRIVVSTEDFLPICVLQLSVPTIGKPRKRWYKFLITPILYVCTFVKGSSKKEHHVVSRRRITSLEATEVSHASSHYMFGRALAPLYSTVSGAALEAPISLLRNRTAGADAL